MKSELRATGIEAIGWQTWGTHLCCLYETEQDLFDLVLPYLRAGLAQNEQVLWITSAPFSGLARAAVAGLGDLAPFLATGQLALGESREWYLTEGRFDRGRIRARGLAAAEGALAQGRAGLRLAADTGWRAEADWDCLSQYEAELNTALEGRRILALCAYGLPETSATEVLDVIEHHQYTLARRHGTWQELAGAELRRSHDEIRALNDTLEQRVAKRTAQLRAANEQLAYHAALMDAIHDAVIATDDKLRITAWNPAAESIYGWTAEEVLGRNLSDVLRSNLDAAGRRAALETALNANEYRVELEHRHKDGSPLHIESVVRALRDAQGRFTGLVGVNRDVTQRKSAEAALRQQKEVLQTVFDHLPVMIAAMDEAGRLTMGNRTWDRVYGWTADEVYAHGMDVLAEAYPDPAELQRVRAFIAAADGEWGEFRTRVRDGRVIDTTWAVVPLPDGTHLHIGQDITERKQTEAIIRREAARTAALLRVARRLNAQLELKKVAEAVCEEAARVMNVPIAALLLWNGARDQFEYVSGVGVPEDLPGRLAAFPVRLYRDETGALRPMIVIEDALAVPDLPNAWAFANVGVRTIVAVTLFHQDEPLGTLAVATTGAMREFDDYEIELLRGLADLSALAIQNARLFQTVSEHRERLRALSAGLVKAQEAERRHIARELHDEVGQLLTGLQLTLSVSGRSVTGPARAGLDEAQKLVAQLMDRAQDLSLALRPPMLDDLGLVPALLWHFEHYTTHTGVKVRFEHGGAGRRFEPEVETTAYRIVQAALTNVARHAGVDEVVVRLWTEDQSLSLQVEDAGKGFDVEAALASGLASGLSGMQERAALVGGQLIVESTPGAGTQITADLPITAGGSEAAHKKQGSPV